MQLITVLCQHDAFSLDGELTMPESIQHLCRSDFWDGLVSSNRAPSHCINAIRQANPPMTLQAIQELIRSRPFSSRLARSHYVQSLYDCILNVSDDSSPVATQIMLDSFAIKLKSEYDGAHGVHRKYKSSICFKSKGAAASQRMEQSVTPFVDCTLTLPKARKQPLTYQDFVEQGETLLIELSKHLERIGREESMVEKELEEMQDEYFSFEKETSGRNQLEVFKEQRDAIEQVVSLTYEEVSTVKKAMKKGEVYSYNRYQPSQFLADRLSTLGSEKVDKGFNCIDQLDPSLSSGPRTFLQHLKHLFSRLLSGKKRPPVNDSLSMLKCSFHSVIHKGAPGAVDDASQQPTTSRPVH